MDDIHCEEDGLGKAEWRQYKAILLDAQHAAERYAGDIFSSRNMWEVSDTWEGMYSVVVEDWEGNRKRFDIEVEMVPEFHASPSQGRGEDKGLEGQASGSKRAERPLS